MGRPHAVLQPAHRALPAGAHRAGTCAEHGHATAVRPAEPADFIWRGRDADAAAGACHNRAEARMTDPIRTFSSLKDAYFRYFDSPFDLRFEELVQSRRALLDRDS